MSLFQKILVVVDAAQSEHPQLERGMKLAEQSQSNLQLVDIVKDVSLTVRLLSRDYTHLHSLLIREKEEQLQRLVDRCRAHGLQADGQVLCGVSSHQTLEAASRLGADLIVRLTKGSRSLQAGHLGTSSQQLLRRLACPLWLADPQHEPQCRSIVAAVDASPDDDAHRQLNRRILQVALQLAKRERAKLRVGYVWSLYGSEMLRHRLPESEYQGLLEFNRRQHQESFEELLAQFDLHATGPDARMLEGEPSQALPELCTQEQADLLVCGTVARHGIPGLFLGNTAERIVNRVACSILALTPPPPAEAPTASPAPAT